MSECMNYFMVNIILPEEVDDEFILLLPEQKVFVKSLMSKGLITSYSLSDDRSRLWVIFKGREQNHVRGLLSCFPIIEKVIYEIVPLVSHYDNSKIIQSISLN